MQPHYIYYLRDPRDRSIRYVGVTNNPEARLFRHVRLNQNHANIRRWLDEFPTELPVLEVQCIVDGLEEGLRVEAALIIALRARGEVLINNVEEERRERIRQAVLQRTPEWNTQNGLRVKAALDKLPPEQRPGGHRRPGYVHSQKTKDKIAATRLETERVKRAAP